MTTRTWVAAAALAAVGAVAGGSAWAADGNAANNVDALTIRITPNVDFGVDVETATAQIGGFSSGDLEVDLDLNATYYLVSPASVTIVGNFNKQEVKVEAVGTQGWTVDTDEGIEADKVQVYALFATEKSSAPLGSEFEADAGRHQLMSNATRVAGEDNGSEGGGRTTNRFEIPGTAMAGGVNMDDLTVGTLRQMWLRLDTPSATTTEGPVEIQVTLTAVNGGSN